MDNHNSYLIVFYEAETGKQLLDFWLTNSIPPFSGGQTLWLEVACYPAWTMQGSDEPQTIRLTKFEIVKVSHSIQRTYSNNILTSYKMEVELKPI